MSAIVAERDQSKLIRLYDALSHRMRFSAPTPSEVRHALETIERALRDGRLVAVKERRVGGAVDETAFVTESGPPPPPAAESAKELTSFELTVVDDMGIPVDGVEVIFSVDGGSRTKQTDGSGRARIADASASFASARLGNITAVRSKLHARWSDGSRSGAPPVGENVRDVYLRRDVDSIPLVAETPTTVVLWPWVLRLRLSGLYFETSKSSLPVKNAIADFNAFKP